MLLYFSSFSYFSYLIFFLLNCFLCIILHKLLFFSFFLLLLLSVHCCCSLALSECHTLYPALCMFLWSVVLLEPILIICESFYIVF